MKPRRPFDEIIIGLLVIIVGLEAWYVLSRGPVALVSEGQHATSQGKGNLPESDVHLGAAQPPHMQQGAYNPDDIASLAPDNYHQLLASLLILNRQVDLTITPTQARRLLDLLRRDEVETRMRHLTAVHQHQETDDKKNAIRAIVTTVDPTQMDFLRQARNDREGMESFNDDDLLKMLKQAQKEFR